MDLPRRPSVDEKLDLGYEIIEQLLLHGKPLTDNQIDRYTKMWIANRRWHETYFAVKMAHKALERSLKLLSECRRNNRIPIAVIQQVCLSSKPSVDVYNSLTVRLVKEKIMSPDVWRGIKDDKIPEFSKVLEFAVPHFLNDKTKNLNEIQENHTDSWNGINEGAYEKSI